MSALVAPQWMIPPTLWSLFGKSLDLGHHIMISFFFDGQGTVEVDIGGVLSQIDQLGRGNQAGFVLGCGQSHPDLAHQQTPVSF